MGCEVSDGNVAEAGYLGYIGGWPPVVALAAPLEAGEPGAVRSLLRETHRAGLVTSFDWPTWMTGRGRELSGHPEAIAAATLEECRRLLVAHLRRDRFVDGHLQAMIANGEIPRILRRAEEITVAKQAANAAKAVKAAEGGAASATPSSSECAGSIPSAPAS
jgi:hypothetical protein